MADIFDYLRWRGDLSFTQIPFNEVDALILAQSTYINYLPYVAKDYSRWITFADIAKADFSSNMPVDTRLLALLKAMGQTRRFGSIQVAGLTDIFDPTEIVQFMAFTLKLPGNQYIVAYRGTDTSITGWRENCTMVLSSSITAQIHAAEYLNNAVRKLCPFKTRKLTLIGHSKGGNEAIYAATFASRHAQKKVSVIYSFDSPGFDQTLYSSGVFSHTAPICRTYVPNESVVGMIMNHEEKLQPVTSLVTGPMQHDPFYWNVCAESFEYAPEISAESKALHTAINEWLSNIPLADRKSFVDTLFGILDSAGIHNFEDLQVSASSKVFRILRSMISVDAEHKHLLHTVFNQLFSSYRKSRTEIPYL